MRINLIILLLLISLVVKATTYNIADQTEFDAFDFSTLVAGDQVLFNRGVTFYGSINITDSGTFGNPITLGAYGTGANPIITGFTAVTAWTNLGGNVWESTSAVSTLSTCNLVAINGVNKAMGRYPNITTVSGENAGYLIRVTDAVNDDRIENASLTGIDWTGAEVATRTHHTRIDRAVISSQSGATIYFPTIANLGSKAGFFIQNDIRTLDVQGEWYYNPSTKKISVYSTSQPNNVKVATIDNLLTVTGNYITVENITFTGSNGIAVKTSSGLSNLVFQNNEVLFAGNIGIELLSTTTALIDGNKFYDTNDNAIRTSSATGVTLTNNDIKNVGLIKGIDPDGGAYAGILTVSGSNFLIQYNSLDSLCNNGINFGSTQTEIRNNFINHCSLNLSDGAAITGHSYSGANTIINGNIVMNGYGAPEGTYDGEFGPKYSAGIYTDDNSVDCTISNNTVYNFPWIGIYLKTSDYITVSGNTTYNNLNGIYIQTYSSTTTHNVMTSNKFVSKTSSQYAAYLRSNVDPDFNSLSTSDYNCFANPAHNVKEITFTRATGSNTTLADWQSFSGLDVNSTTSPFTISSENELRFEYNETSTEQVKSLPYRYKRLDGTLYNGTITLQPYTAEVLFYVSPIVPPAPPSNPIKRFYTYKGQKFKYKNIIRGTLN